jgi:hypothetical protein
MLFLIDRFTRGFKRSWAPISVKLAMKYLGITRQFVHETWKTLDELGYIRIWRPEHGSPNTRQRQKSHSRKPQLLSAAIAKVLDRESPSVGTYPRRTI